MAGTMTTRTFMQSQLKVVHKTYTRGAQEVPSLYPVLFNDYENDMKRSFMNFIPYVGLGTLQNRTEGAVPVFDQAIEGPPTTVNFASWSLGYMVTKEAGIEDAMNALAELPHFLAYSAQVTYDQLIWNILNLAFTASVILADGVALCSTAHPLAGPGLGGVTYSNSLGTVAITPESIQAADVALLTLVNDRNLPASVTPKYLVVPPVLAKTAEEINGSNFAPYTSDNRINVQAGKKEIIVSRYLTSPTGFFVTGGKGRLGMNSHSMFYSWKYMNDQNTWIDDNTRNFNHTIDSRGCFGTIDGRGVVGSQGS